MPAAPPNTRVMLLGPPTITGPLGTAGADGLPGSQPRVLLARLLLAHGRTVSVEVLAESLWESTPPSTWRPALRGLVLRCRRFVETACGPEASLVGTGKGFRLTLPAPVEVDALTVQEDAVAAEVAFATQRYEDALTAAASVERRTRSDFLDGSTGSWASEKRSRFDEIRLRSLLLMGEVHLAREQPVRAVRSAQESLDAAPHSEAGYRLLMRSYAANGEIALALACYERCRSALGEAYGVDPSPATKQLHTDLMRGS